MAKENKPEVIVIENLELGWISDYVGQTIPLDGAEGQYRNSFGMTTVRPGKKGHIAPSEIFNNLIFTDIGPVINSLPRAICLDTGLVTYKSFSLLGGGASNLKPRIVVSDNTNSTSSNHDITATNTFNTTVPSTGFWGEDIIFYRAYADSVGTFKDFAFYSWNDSVSGDIGRYDIGANSYIDDFMSGTTGGNPAPSGAAKLTGGVPHRMCEAPDKIVYITNGQFIASYDSTTDQAAASGTFNPKALDLGSGWMAVDVQPYQNDVVIAAIKIGGTYQNPSAASQSRVILWNGSDLDFTQVYEMNDWWIGSLFPLGGSLFAFTQGVNGTTKAKWLPLGSAEFEIIWEAPITIVGGAPKPNQVEYFNGMIQWAGDNSTNMVFGLIQTNKGWTLHTPYYLSSGTGTVTQAGFLKNINSNQLYVGVNGFKIIGLFGDGNSNGSIVASQSITKVQLRDRIRELPYKATIKKIKVIFSSFGSDSSLFISLIPNYSPYSEDGSGNPVGDKLAWTISTANHANITTTLTASTSELGGRATIATDISIFWLNIRDTNSSVTATPPIIKRLEISIEPPEKP